jgi:esterase/lipase
VLPALAVLAGMALGRVGYPRYLEWRQRRRRPMGEDGVIAGAAPITLHRAGAPAVLVLHGGGDTPQVVAQLGRALHDRGFSVRAPLLAGHGRHLSALQAASAANWHDQVVTEFDQLRRDHSAVAVVGLSMAGKYGTAHSQ